MPNIPKKCNDVQSTTKVPLILSWQVSLTYIQIVIKTPAAAIPAHILDTIITAKCDGIKSIIQDN